MESPYILLLLLFCLLVMIGLYSKSCYLIYSKHKWNFEPVHIFEINILGKPENNPTKFWTLPKKGEGVSGAAKSFIEFKYGHVIDGCGGGGGGGGQMSVFKIFFYKKKYVL